MTTAVYWDFEFVELSTSMIAGRRCFEDSYFGDSYFENQLFLDNFPHILEGSYFETSCFGVSYFENQLFWKSRYIRDKTKNGD